MKTSAMHGESGYERIEGDKYYTPAWCTEVLLKYVDFTGGICEPACGDGAVVKVLEAAGHGVLASDIAPEMKDAFVHDFFAGHKNGAGNLNCKNIVTNPPFNLAEKFVCRALRMTEAMGGKVAMLLRNEWDSASSRSYLFRDNPFAMKIVLTKRPRWIAGSKGGPRHNYSWFVWDHAHKGLATMRWDK